MISIDNINVEFSAKPLFKDVSFVINPSEKIALAGRNGAGKSTLLKIIAGEETPTSGKINYPGELKIGYLPQHKQLENTTTVKEEVKKVVNSKLQISEELSRLHDVLLNVNPESEEYFNILEKIDLLNNQLDIESVNSLDGKIEKILIGLGFKRDDFERPTSEFSGGWRMRIELAKILLQDADVLLLDEPTNHLDIESIQWLEDFLKSRKKALVLVSHDRQFLDNVTNRTIEISGGKIYDYKANYSHFLNLRLERIEQQKREYKNQQKEINDLKDFIERFRYKPTKSNQVQSRIKQLEKIKPIEIDEIDKSVINLKFPPVSRSGDFPLIIENLAKKYDDNQVFSNLNIEIKRGEKIALVGKNGEGKSTFLKCLMKEIEYEGTVKIGHNVNIGYFAQDSAARLDENLTVFETLDNIATGDIRFQLKDLLGAFLFKGNDIDKKVKVLSGGEKSRLALIKMLLRPINLLIMDEPTNHLDIPTKELLKNALKNFDGTLLIVSHDRYFLNGLAEKVFEFSNGKLSEYMGGMDDFIHQKRWDVSKNSSEIESATNKNLPKNDVTSSNNIIDAVDKKELYLLQKEKEKKIKKTEKSIKNLETEIANIELLQSEIENKLQKGIVTDDILSEYENNKQKLEELLEKWEEANNEYKNLVS